MMEKVEKNGREEDTLHMRVCNQYPDRDWGPIPAEGSVNYGLTSLRKHKTAEQTGVVKPEKVTFDLKPRHTLLRE